MNNRKYVKEGLILILGSFVYAVAVEIFLSPLKISPGGITGIAAAINYATKFPTGTLILIINIPIILFALVKFGKVFIVKSAVAILFSSLFIDIIDMLYKPLYFDTMLCAVFGGALMGAGIGLAMLVGASTGGIDIVVKTLNKNFNISMGRAFLIIDGAVIAFAAFVYGDVESALYSAITVFVSSKIVDIILCGAFDSKAVFVISDKEDAIKKEITQRVERGITILPAFGGYTGRKNNILLCIARNNEISEVRKLITEHDPNAFFFIVNAGDVIGKGFK